MAIKYNVQKRIDHIKSLGIPEKNKKHIISFIEDQAAQGNSKARQVKYASILGKISELITFDFEKATKEDIKKICSNINRSEMSEWTKHDYLLTIKVFYKYLADKDNYSKKQKEYFKNIVEWIKPKKARNHKKLPRELLTIEDAKAIANNTNNPRDRCLVLLLYETGARISELLGLQIKDVEFEDKYARITLPDNGKTGARKVLIVASAPAITNWLRYHPKKEDKNSFLLCGLNSSNKGQELQYRHVNELLKEAGKKAGITKPLNPHHFRHSRATELAMKLTEAQLCTYMGWVIGSREAATYVHLSGRDTDDKIKELYGLKTEEKDEIVSFKPIECPRCSIVNDAASKFCNGCGLGLDEKSILEYDQQKEQAAATGFAVQQAMSKDELYQMMFEKLQKMERQLKDLQLKQ